MRLRGKVVVVTGGTRGLGRSIAEAALREGAHVVCAARSEGDVELIRELGNNRVSFQQTDVCDRDSIDELMGSTYANLGRLDVLVCNAGVSNDSLVRNLKPTEWSRVIDTNLSGVYHCTQAVVPYMQQQGGGRIINISSALSTRVSPGAGAYSASKAAIDMFTKVCAVEFAELGITVNAVSPGFIEAGMGERLAGNDLVWDTYESRLLAGRLGRGEDVGNAVVFLASADGSYVNSHILEVNGGLLWN